LAGSTAIADHKEWNKYLAGSWDVNNGEGEQDFRLAVDGNVVVGTGKSAAGEESVWVLGWDPAEKTIIHEWFGADTHGRAVYKIIDDKTLRGTGVYSESGNLTKGAVTVLKKDDTTFTVKWTEVSANGKKSPDFDVVVKRK